MTVGSAAAQATGAAKSLSAVGLLACATLRTRIELLLAPAISRDALSVAATDNSMFDWPEQSHTSPTSTSETAWLAPDCERTLSVYGPPAAIAGSIRCNGPMRPRAFES